MNTNGVKKIAFVAYPGLTPLDLIGPLQVMSAMANLAPGWEALVVGERIEPMATDAGPLLVPQATFEDVSDPTVVLVPGGMAPTIKQMGNPVLREYLTSAAATAEVVGSVCTGALILASAGLLEGRKATTHWAVQKLLERLGVTYLPERWVEDGKFITSAGVSAGIDMAIELASRLTSVDTARFAQLWIEYDPRPPFGGIEWESVDRHAFVPMFLQHVQENLSEDPELQARLLELEVA